MQKESDNLKSPIDDDFEFNEVTEEVNSQPELNYLHEPPQITNLTNQVHLFYLI